MNLTQDFQRKILGTSLMSPEKAMGEDSGDKKTNKHKQFFGIVPGKGVGQNCLCVACSWGEKHENDGTVVGQSWDNPVNILFMCFLCIGFLGPRTISKIVSNSI